MNVGMQYFLCLLFLTKWLNSASFHRRPKRTKWPNLQPLFKSSTIAAISFKRQQPKTANVKANVNRLPPFFHRFVFVVNIFFFNLRRFFTIQRVSCLYISSPIPTPIQTASKYHLYKESCFTTTTTNTSTTTTTTITTVSARTTALCSTSSLPHLSLLPFFHY